MSNVQLYVYDLSRGMAKQMSLSLTGKQIDGIWHTSVVVFGREIFYGQGILESRPGMTHHGQPVQKIDFGDTQIDRATFDEYLESLAGLYTAEAYNLLEFNCNNFTADVVGFLTGKETPTWITGLPAEFLATPFGQMLKPQIDQMFRSRSSSEHRVNPHVGSSTPAAPTPTRTPPPNAAATAANPLLSSIANAATAAPPASALSLITSSANFQTVLKQPAVVCNFTNTAGCAPCRAIKPVYEAIAAEYGASHGGKGLRFVEVELGVGEGRDIASRYGVSATPTFQFFRDGKKVAELRGAGKRDLEGKVEEFVESVWPRHPHRKMYVAVVDRLPTSAITSAASPNYAALLGKLEGFAGSAKKDELDVLRRVTQCLEGKGDAAVLPAWRQATASLVDSLPAEQIFPLVDLWRIGVLQPAIASALIASLDPIPRILDTTNTTLKSLGTSAPKPLLLTVLRLLTNLAASVPLTNVLLAAHTSPTISITVDALLHPDAPVRSAAAGLAVNLAHHRHRLAASTGRAPEDGDEAEWETELLSALIEAVGRETDEDVAHRLLVALAHTVWLNPGYEGMRELMDVLEAKKIVAGRVQGYKKVEVKKLAQGLVDKVL